MSEMLSRTDRVRLGTIEKTRFSGLEPSGKKPLPQNEFNLVAVPNTDAAAFRRFCRLNSKACPVVAQTRPGSHSVGLDPSCDVRIDADSYDLHSFGEYFETQSNVVRAWRNEMTGFVLGSVAALDMALRAQRIFSRERWQGARAFYRTRFPTVNAGPFKGELIVSMRSVPRDDVDRLRAVASRYPLAHGAPVHVGDPADLGIDDLSTPDWGNRVTIGANDVPVFFASSLTALNAAANAQVSLAITTTPGTRLQVSGGSNFAFQVC